METKKKRKVQKYSERTEHQISSAKEYNKLNYKKIEFRIKISDLEKLENSIKELGSTRVFYFKNALKIAYNLDLK
jgi:hypothetical protein